MTISAQFVQHYHRYWEITSRSNWIYSAFKTNAPIYLPRWILPPDLLMRLVLLYQHWSWQLKVIWWNKRMSATKKPTSFCRKHVIVMSWNISHNLRGLDKHQRGIQIFSKLCWDQYYRMLIEFCICALKARIAPRRKNSTLRNNLRWKQTTWWRKVYKTFY